MNTMNQPFVSPDLLEKQLQQRISEYTLAENDGKGREELNAIYQEIKKIRYQLTLHHYKLNQPTQAQQNNSYL